MHSIPLTQDEIKRRKAERLKAVRRIRLVVVLLRRCGFVQAPEWSEVLDEVGARTWAGASGLPRAAVVSHYWIKGVPESVIDIRELDFTTLPEAIEFIFQFAFAKGGSTRAKGIRTLLGI